MQGDVTESIYRMTFWKRNNLIKRKFRGSRAGKKPRHLLWNVFIVLLQYIWKFFVIIGHLDPSRQQCTHQHPRVYTCPHHPPTPRPHRLIHFAVFSNTPLPPFPLLIKASRFTGTEEYGLFVLFVQWFSLLLLYHYCLYHFIFGNYP